MNGRIAILCAVLLIMLPSAFGQNQVQVVNTGEITNIDAKKMTLKVRSDSNQSANPGPRPGGGGGRRGGGGGIGVGLPGGGGRRGGGGGYPGGTSTGQSQAREYKVTLTKDTLLKEGEATISFDSFKKGDHIIVSGNPKGNDIEATSITRDTH